MNRILTWFLISLLLALSGPVQALSMASARGFEKSLYGRSTPCRDKMAYCSGDPINNVDPSGLRPSGPVMAGLAFPQQPPAPNWRVSQSDINRARLRMLGDPGTAQSGGPLSPEFVGDMMVGELAFGLGGRAIGAARRAGAADLGEGLGGTLVSQEEFDATKAAMAELGIEIGQNAKLGRNGQFTALGIGRAAIDFGEKLPSTYVFFHELAHAQQFLQLGFNAYRGLRKADKEGYVLNFLQGLPLNATEWAHARNYAAGF